MKETVLLQQPNYRCQKHGEIGNTTIRVILTEWSKYSTFNKDKDFCLFCFYDMLEEHCYEAKKI